VVSGRSPKQSPARQAAPLPAFNPLTEPPGTQQFPPAHGDQQYAYAQPTYAPPGGADSQDIYGSLNTR
jgi:hypothetical protein